MEYELEGNITYVVELFMVRSLGHVRRVQAVGSSSPAAWYEKVQRDPETDPLATQIHGNEWRKLVELNGDPSDDAIALERAYHQRWVKNVQDTGLPAAE